MAEEIRVSPLSVNFRHKGDEQEFSWPAQVLDLDPDTLTAGRGESFRNKTKVGTTEVAMDLGQIATNGGAPGVCIISNLMDKPADEDDYVLSVRAATAGTKIIDVLPGECHKFRFGTGVTAPYLISTTAGTWVSYMIVEK